jgi:HPt (histidine-containing phosphotransfer) domain-containing protein
MMDLTFLNRQMAGDEKLVARFVSIFKAQVPAQVSQLQGLCENEDWEELSTALHSLKTQFNYMLMTEFAEQMREMEECVDNGETALIATRIAEFTKKFDLFWQTEFPEN